MRLVIALALLLAAPAAAAAEPPWSAPATVAEGQVFPRAVLYTGASGGAVFWQRGEGATSEGTAVANLMAAPLDAGGGPGASRRVGTLDGALGAGRRFTFAGFKRVPGGTALVAGSAAAPGARLARGQVGHVRRGLPTPVAAGGAVAYVVRPAGRPGQAYVALSRLSGARYRGAARISARGRVGELALAANGRGDVLAAWQRADRLEARIVTAAGVRSPVRTIARAAAPARHLDVALAGDGTAVAGWVEQSISEGEGLSAARVRAAVRRPGRRFGPARLLEAYPDREIAGGRAVRVTIAAGRPIAAWTGRRAVRAAFADGTGFGAPQDLAPLGDRTYDRGGGLADLVAGPGGTALALWLAPQDPSGLRVMAASLAAGAGAFGPAEAVSEPGGLLQGATAAFDPRTGVVVAAWGEAGPTANRVLAASRPAP
jgi:hypothetical protein